MSTSSSKNHNQQQKNHGGCFALFDPVRDILQLLFAGREMTGAVRKCHTLAGQCGPMTILASEKGRALVSLSGNCQSMMQGLKQDNHHGGLEGPKLFLTKIQHLLDDSQIVQSIADCQEMVTLAKKLVTNTNDMAATLDKAIDSLPDDMVDDDDDDNDADPPAGMKTKSRSVLAREIDDEDDDDDSTQALVKLLSTIDTDIDDVYNSSNQARGGLDIFTASTMGTQVFEMTQAKGQLAVDLFQQMKNVNTVLVDRMGNLVAETTCCSKIQAAVQSVSTLLRCQKLVKVLVTASTAVERLTDALEKLIDTAWQKMQGFLDQLSAAKKLNQSVQDVKGQIETGTKALDQIKEKSKKGIRMFGLS
jgi:hypothetical protein